MIIVNSKHNPSYHTLSTPQPFSTGYSSKKQFDSIKQLQNEEELSIIQWIKEKFYQEFSHCKKVSKLQDLYDGIALAQIISSYLSHQQQRQIFLNEIQLVDNIQNKSDRQIAVNNLNLVIEVIQEMHLQILSNFKQLTNKNKNHIGLIKLIEISKNSLEHFEGQSLIGNKNKMKNFMMQVVMILPEIVQTIKQQKQSSIKKIQKQSIRPSINSSRKQIDQRTNQKRISLNKKQRQYESSVNNIEQLSSIIGYSTVPNYQKTHFENVIIDSNSSKYTDSNKQTKQNKQTNSNKQTNCKKETSLNKQKLPSKQQNSNKSQRRRSNKHQNSNQSNIKYNNCQIQNYELRQNNENENDEMNQNERLFQNKVQKLLNWIQISYNIDICKLMQPHILLGQLVNNIIAPNRFKDNQKPIKPTHYQLGSYSVYKKTLDLLASIQRLNKNNLINLMKQVQYGKVNQITFWNLIQDIQSMVKNKISQPLSVRKQHQSIPKPITKPTQQSQKVTTQYDQNINIENIKNQSVTQLLKQKNIKNGQLKDAPLYLQQTIKQTQLWLQHQMGMGHPLNKSKSNSNTTILENPLFNGTLYAKIIQRLKIGSAKGVTTSLNQKQLKSNIQIVKNELLNRGYEVARKISIYKPSYNFYIGLLSQIREIHINKQSNTKRQIYDDKQRKQLQQASNEISAVQKIQLQKWILSEYNQTIQQVNGIKQISLKQLRLVIESIVKINFMKETTQKIRFFRSIGFSHYCIVKVDDIISQSMSKYKKTQNLRWMILRDLKIIKGDKQSIHY